MDIFGTPDRKQPGPFTTNTKQLDKTSPIQLQIWQILKA